MDASIILQGQPVNVLGALNSGTQLAANTYDLNRQGQYNALLRQHGAGIAAGNQDSLNALAAFDPQAALGVQQTRLGMDATRQNMDFAAEQMGWDRERVRRETEAWAAQQDAATVEAERARLEAGLKGASFFYQRGDRAGYDNFLTENGVDPATVPFDQFPAQAAMYGDVLDTMKKFGPADPTEGAPAGHMWKNPADRSQGLVRLEGYRTDPLVNVNTGGESAFNKKTGELLAQEAADIVTAGATAQRSLGQIMTLESALNGSPQGMIGALASLAGEYGFKTEGADQIELATSVISQLVPTQRAPGSGTMSDRDIDLFKASLPRLINTPKGNKMIVDSLKAIAEYDVARGQIARQLQLGKITPEEADAQYMALGNPLAEFVKEAQGGQTDPATGATTPPPAAQPASPPPADGGGQWIDYGDGVKVWSPN